ncbi:hypothetical protein F4805DRAFT_477071 [Annulohypoxylon moriforme]|nr:hypothetical protein F4805DRAFT_477071 [Annulohypoxylon moriforme]
MGNILFRKFLNYRRETRDETQLHQAASESQDSSSNPASTSVNATSGQLRKKNESEAGPLGLSVVYTPDNARKADIVFIHGLGGSSRWTWSKNRDPDLFWPSKFLPLEPDIRLARILTFGYKSDLRKPGSVGTSILYSSKELLFDLKFGDGLNIGSVPLIFVAHSMGGLIVKEAFMQSQKDPMYYSIAMATSAIVFLSTPHPSSYLASSLNLLLRSTQIPSPGQHISELMNSSSTLENINAQFRHSAHRLHIVSFYETQPTSVGLMNCVIVEKDDSIIGGEISAALDADHHNVCKFGSPTDPNYTDVRDAIKFLLDKATSKTKAEASLLTREELSRLKTLVPTTELPFTDYSFFKDQKEPETCEWILQDKAFIKWEKASDSKPCFLWLCGGPATGKSVLSSFVIHHLVERRAHCQYFFIRFDDHKKRTLGLLLRSIAFQLAQTFPSFARSLIGLDVTIDYKPASANIIWDRIFKSGLVDVGEELKPLYWVIDGLDEALDSRAIIELLSDVSRYSIPLRILFTGRKTSEIVAVFRNVPNSLNLEVVAVEGHAEDLSRYIHRELDVSGGSGFRENTIKQIVERSQNNFLWVRLAVDRLNSCHRLSDVELAFQELPMGIEALYQRMASSIARKRFQDDKALASKILGCVASSFRGLSITELPDGLGGDASKNIDFKRLIIDLCGGFVTVDNNGNIRITHHTAREYLLSTGNRSFYIDITAAHERMFLSCMDYLMATDLLEKVKQSETPGFVDYALSWWSLHLALVSPGRTRIVEVLKKFLTNFHILTWIHIIFMKKQQQLLIQASEDLSRYRLKQQNHAAEMGESNVLVEELELFERWSICLVKILEKFSADLQRNPKSTYDVILPFLSSEILGIPAVR